jgi:glycosyltransferase involved in cell wall biosynthesis
MLAARDDLAVYMSLSRESEMYADFDGLPVSGRFDVNTYESVIQFGLRSLKLPLLRRQFARYIQEQKIDVVFCTMDHLWNSFVMGCVRDSVAAYLLTVHDATRHPGEDQSWRRWLLRRDIHASDAVLVLSRSVGASLQANYGYPSDRIFLSTLGHFGDGRSDTGVRRLPAERPAHLLFFGRILHYKGLDLMLEALPILRKEFPKLRLEVWGTGDITPYQAALDAVGDVRVENRWVKEEEIPRIFAATDLAVLPYREASQSAVVATAFSLGMPCVATPIPGLCEQVADGVTGVIATGNSPAEYAEAVAKILRDPDFYERLSLGCLQAAATTLSWDNIGLSVAEALHVACAKGKREKDGRA